MGWGATSGNDLCLLASSHSKSAVLLAVVGMCINFNSCISKCPSTSFHKN